MHARDLSYHEHRELFRQVRQELNLVRAKGLTDEGIELLQLVNSLGSPPRQRVRPVLDRGTAGMEPESSG